MTASQRRRFLFSFICLLLILNISNAQQIKLSFEEVAQSADLIFIGTVGKQPTRMNEKGNMILTDVTFNDIEVVSATQRSIQKDSQVVCLTYAGGCIGDACIKVSDMPNFIDGHRYLIFMYDDGKIYINPMIGGYQGKFEIIKDPMSNTSSILTTGRKAILGADARGIVLSHKRVSSMQNGNLVYEEQPEEFRGEAFAQNPTLIDSVTKCIPRQMSKVGLSAPLGHSAFIDYIRNVALRSPLKSKLLKRGEHEQGSFYKRNGDKIEVEKIKSSTPPMRSFPEKEENNNGLNALPKVPLRGVDLSSQYTGLPKSQSILAGTFGACGYHDVPLVMEEVPTSWWEYNLIMSCLSTWNIYMDLYHYNNGDGYYSWNGKNEFCGYVSNANLYRWYGFQWGGYLAMCVYYEGSNCGKITESDVMWNPDYSWTSDAELAIGNPDVILLRPVNMHELGHTWGEMCGSYTETYDYDFPTVMHAYYYNIIENGMSIHPVDAYYFRRNYQDQIAINHIKDVGVKSYYASDGLHNSTTDDSIYYPGATIALNGVTMENNSDSAVANFNIRFYLSKDRTITTSDYPMGSSAIVYSSWPAERYHTINFSTAIHGDVPAGTYYVGAMVHVDSVNGNDNFWPNNSTSFFDPITIIYTVPTITSIEPSSKNLGDSAFTMTVNGTNFVPVSQVQFKNSDRPTTYISPTQLEVTIPASDLMLGIYTTIVVVNPTPGGGTSNYLLFAINNPVPELKSIEPSVMHVGDEGFTMTLRGANFTSRSKVQLDGEERTTVYIDSSHLTAIIPASDMTMEGTHTITVVTPTPEGGTSAALVFTVNALTVQAGISAMGDILTISAKPSANIEGVYSAGRVSIRWLKMYDVTLDKQKNICGPWKVVVANQASGDYLYSSFSFTSESNRIKWEEGGIYPLFDVPITQTGKGWGTFELMEGSHGESAWYFELNGTDLTNYTNPFFAPSVSEVPLPVQLVNFNGRTKGSEVELIWKTAMEVNSYGFEVERRRIQNEELRMKNEEWIKVGFVSGAGSSNTQHDYTFSDSKLTTGRYAYRLKQIDNGGLFKYSGSIEVEIKNMPTIFSLDQNYPNPFNPSTTIRFGLPVRSRVKLEVLNILGQSLAKLVDEEKEAGFVEAVWYANVASGLYLYRVEAVSAENPNQRFVAVKKMLLLK